MKVITIGRNPDNDVCIHDPYVGRHHCQIVQYDNGTYAIVDMGSTNGTYVNGKRIYGEAQLQPYDSVSIGPNPLPWMNYFPPVVPQSKKSKALPITLGITGGMLLLAVVAILCFWLFRSGSDKAFAFKGECPDAVVVDMTNEDGVPYTIEAIEGQVCVWFEEGTPYKTAKKSIKASGGRIVAQIPEDGYYLVTVPADKVQVFLKRITKENYVDWAYPNLVYYPCIAKTFVLDNFYPRIGEKDTTPHGDMVQFALQDYDKKAVLKSYNIGRKGGKSMNVVTDDWQIPMSSNNTAFAVFDILSSSGDEPLIINMSFGVSLPKHYKDGKRVNYYWTEATDREKESYRNWYLQGMKNVIHNVRSLKGKDFVIVKSAGNEGVKVFGDSIISYLRQNLTPEEKKIMDEHFLLVTAGETEERHKDYSNEMEEGRYDPWVTKVDVSDFKYNGEKRRGTSFAAPRATGILSSVANEMNLTGAEVLKYAREATRNSSDHSLTYESMKNTIAAHKSITSQPSVPQPTTPQPSTPQPVTPRPSTPQPNPPQPTTPSQGDLVGTKWKCIHDKNNSEKRVYTIFEFVSSHDCNVTIRYQDSNKEDKISVKFDYSSAEKEGCFKNSTGFYGECFRYDNNTLTIELLYKNNKRETYIFKRIK